ncbi:CBS domain-containing protein [Natrialba sp. INN-245]|uniref:CBS domain-containing protein n=1 Tax=Natrialba sp. INN-245 TaxID=2690967 RepID=UPI0013129C5A|nr:CBS domain-containing protein [Natrialba sp. INN-245]MWV41369.1 CBS domain-containing protein [Natrialba sp. INN-245]
MCAQIQDVMTEDVISCENTTSLQRVAELMIRHDVGSVVITTDGDPYGIVTESDLIEAGYKSGKPFAEIPTRAVASHPLETVDPTRGIRFAVKRMQEERIKKLVVVEELDVCGIVTVQDLLDHYGTLNQDLRKIHELRDR